MKSHSEAPESYQAPSNARVTNADRVATHDKPHHCGHCSVTCTPHATYLTDCQSVVTADDRTGTNVELLHSGVKHRAGEVYLPSTNSFSISASHRAHRNVIRVTSGLHVLTRITVPRTAIRRPIRWVLMARTGVIGSKSLMRVQIVRGKPSRVVTSAPTRLNSYRQVHGSTRLLQTVSSTNGSWHAKLSRYIRDGKRGSWQPEQSLALGPESRSDRQNPTHCEAPHSRSLLLAAVHCSVTQAIQ
jgi:hypothetical protein